MASAVGALVVLAVSLVGGRLLVDLLVGQGWPLLVYVALLSVVGYGPSVAWCVYVSRRWGTGSVLDDLGARPRWSDLGWGPVVWFGAVCTQIVVGIGVIAARIPTGSNVDGVSELRADRTYVVALLVTAVIAAPIVEELVFRGVVMRGFLSRWAAPVAIGLQGVLFGVVHVDPVRGAENLGLAIVLSGVGVALGVAAYLLRRIGPAIVAHAIFNGVVLVIVLTGVLERLQELSG